MQGDHTRRARRPFRSRGRPSGTGSGPTLTRHPASGTWRTGVERPGRAPTVAKGKRAVCDVAPRPPRKVTPPTRSAPSSADAAMSIRDRWASAEKQGVILDSRGRRPLRARANLPPDVCAARSQPRGYTRPPLSQTVASWSPTADRALLESGAHASLRDDWKDLTPQWGRVRSRHARR